MSGTAFGQVAGIPIGKVLATGFGYQWPFLMFAVPMALSAVLIWLYVPQPDAELDEKRLTPRRLVEKYRTVLRGSDAVNAVLSYLLMFSGFGLFTSFLPSWLESTVGVTSYEIALLFAIGGTANILAAPLGGRVSDQIGRKPIVVWASLALGLLMAVAPLYISGFMIAAVLFFLAMALIGIRVSPLQSLITALVPDRQRGLLMGLAMSVGQAGFGFGSFVASLTYGPFGYLSNAARRRPGDAGHGGTRVLGPARAVALVDGRPLCGRPLGRPALVGVAERGRGSVGGLSLPVAPRCAHCGGATRRKTRGRRPGRAPRPPTARARGG
jgi:predicted MFS family arabinose efflux permease